MAKKSGNGISNKSPRRVGKGDTTLGIRLRLRRVEQKMSQSDLADKLGVSFQQIQKYEKGVNRISAPRLLQIAKLLEVPVTFFYDEDGTKASKEVDSLLFLDSAFSLRLLRAYSSIGSRRLQQDMVNLMESVAEAHPA